MKKTRFLVLALTVAVMLMGAGYAWWNETVVIDTDVSTGYLDVDLDAVTPNTAATEFVTVKVTPVSSIDGNDSGEYCDIDITNLYPGAFGEGTVAVKNTGTMRVKLGQPILSSTDNWAGWMDYVDIRYTPTLTDNGANVPLTRDGDKFKFDGNVYLEPGETCFFKIRATMPSSVDGDELKSNLGFEFKPVFLQWNQQ